ncbi:MAG: FAD-dependent oxidoreductase [Candidatus Omnitrophota bacterium]|nr:MAG: FAD-dependent oxidoreductase [Candidatus Omnitrophota bacterium]
MQEIVVLGAGIAGLHLIEQIRKKEPSCRITLIDKNFYSFDKMQLLEHLSIKNWIDTSMWAQTQNVEFIQESVERLSLRRRKIYFKERESLSFERLIVATGLTSKRIAIKGEHRQGFFYLSQIDPFQIKDMLRIYEEATVYASTILGIKLALAIRALGKEVRVVGPMWGFLGEAKESVVSFLNERGIPTYLNAQIDEAIGEGTVKATKISPLKVFSSQFLFVDSGFVPNSTFIEEEVQLKDVFFTEYEGVFFLGDVTRRDIENEFFFVSNYAEAKSQASLFADYIVEEKFPRFERKSHGHEDLQKAVDGILQMRDYSDERMRFT